MQHRLRENDPTLTELEFRSTRTRILEAKLTDDFVDALRTNTTLKRLSFIDIPIGDAGARAIAGALTENKTLTELNLYNTQIGDEGVIAIANALRKNNALQTLFFDNNPVGNDGARAIAGILRENKTLAQLGLVGTRMGDAGAIEIADALRQNTTLTLFVFNGNQRIRATGLKALARTAALMGRNVFGIFSDVTFEMIETEKINIKRIKYDNARAAVRAYLMAGKRGDLPDKNRDTIRKAARALWETRDDDVWLFDPAERDAQGDPKRARTATTTIDTNACIGCIIGTPALFHEQHDPARRFCSAYCQLIHYYQLPDLRGMTPAQIERALVV